MSSTISPLVRASSALEFRRSLSLPIAPAEVFAFVSDFRNATRWDPRVLAASERSDRPPGLGAQFVLTSRVLGRTVDLPYEVVAFERPRLVALAGSTALFDYYDEILVEPMGSSGARLSYVASLSLRGPLAPVQTLLGPVLDRVFRRIGDDALAGIEAALLDHVRVHGPRSAELPSRAHVRSIVALDDRPVLRNLLITHTYWQISERLTQLLGCDANWCTFATWASKLAGSYVRRERLDSTVELADELGRYVTAGNLQVFAEIAEVFVGFIEAFEDDARRGAPTPGRLERFLAGLRRGLVRPDRLALGVDGSVRGTLVGGQSLLREAMAAYHAALFEPDARARSQLVLLGNALVGLHEQTRLQSYILAGLDAPLRWLPGAARRRVLASLSEQLRARLREAGTLALLHMPLPGETLALGRDLPAPVAGAEARLYPAELEQIDHPRLHLLLREFEACNRPCCGGSGLRRAWLEQRGRLAARRRGRPVIVGSAARDWGRLRERMRFIVHYFRSRQRHAPMFEAPFTPLQQAQLLAGRVPLGPL